MQEACSLRPKMFIYDQQMTEIDGFSLPDCMAGRKGMCGQKPQPGDPDLRFFIQNATVVENDVE